MTDLSPATQAVKDAVLALYPDKATQDIGWPLDIPTIAAALRAATNQVAPETPHSEPDDPEILKGIWDERRTIRAEFLAIATELENSNV